MSNASKVLLPYKMGFTTNYYVRSNMDYGDTSFIYGLCYVARDDHGGRWHAVCLGRLLAVKYPSKKAAMKALDLILIENGYTLLTEEQVKKIEILL